MTNSTDGNTWDDVLPETNRAAEARLEASLAAAHLRHTEGYRSSILADAQAAFPALDISIAAPSAEDLEDLSLTEDADLAELVISSAGPGHYTVPLPAVAEVRPAFRLFFVNVNDMPGDGEELGTYPTPTDAVAAAASFEAPDSRGLSGPERLTARSAVAAAALDFPSPPGAASPSPVATSSPRTEQREDGAGLDR